MRHERKDTIGDPEVRIPESKLKLHSIGYAAENLEFGKTLLEVSPYEDLPYLHGELNSERGGFEEKGVDALGNEYNVKIETSNTVVAEWLPNGSNRVSAPNVRRGERVYLYQYADVDKYYWTTTGLDDGVRRRETVTYAFSNTVDESVEKMTPENAYFFEISTHQKHITLKTNKSDTENPEPFAYTIQINTKDGSIHIQDDIGNEIQLDSKEKQIILKNADSSIIDLNKTNCTVTVPNNFTVNASTATINATTTINGTTTVNGSTTINGNTATKGSLTNNGTDVGSGHTHKGVTPGRGSTGTPN